MGPHFFGRKIEFDALDEWSSSGIFSYKKCMKCRLVSYFFDSCGWSVLGRCKFPFSSPNIVSWRGSWCLPRGWAVFQSLPMVFKACQWFFSRGITLLQSWIFFKASQICFEVFGEFFCAKFERPSSKLSVYELHMNKASNGFWMKHLFELLQLFFELFLIAWLQLVWVLVYHLQMSFWPKLSLGFAKAWPTPMRWEHKFWSFRPWQLGRFRQFVQITGTCFRTCGTCLNICVSPDVSRAFHAQRCIASTCSRKWRFPSYLFASWMSCVLYH